MEPWHGRRGKDQSGGGVCGVTRAHQSMLLMVAMVATMAVVLLWEASPLVVSGVAQSPVLKVPISAFDEQANSYQSRSFLRRPPAEKTNEGPADLTESDVSPVAEETEPETTALEASAAVEDEPQDPKPKSSATVFDPEKNETSIADSISTSNKTVTEPAEDISSTEEETTLAGKNATVAGEEAPHLARNPTASESTLTAEEKAEIYSEARPDESFLEETGSKAGHSVEGDAEEAISQESDVREEATCDYTVGKWVLDETRPLYSGFECKMWLSPGFSCRLNNHPDKLLDRYRWQPAGCDLPVFNASAVLEMLRNKVVAFVGDSLGRQQLQSLLCMLTRGKNDTAISDIGSSFGFFTPRGERKPNGFAFRFDATNTTIMYKWSVTLARIQPLNATDPQTPNALHLDLPEEFIEKHLPVIDVLVLNSGHHWNNGKMRQNRFEFYLDGKPVNKSREVSRVPVAYNATVHNVVHWIDNATKATPEKIVYYRSLSPRHFRNGDWNTGGTCDTIMFGGKDNHAHVQEGLRVDPNAESAVVGTTVNLLNITSLSLERGETHVSKYGGGTGGQDCLHWCLPGIPDTWNEIFFADLATKFKRRAELHRPNRST